ncbi:MAG: hypothetical protein ACOZNI_01845 [Myxococcota bacterium]
MLPLLALVVTAEAKKPAAPPPPPVGWWREAGTKKTPGWKGDCYFPPNWDKLGEGDRKLERQKALEAMKSQWLGQRDDGVTIDAGAVDELETVLLGRPQLIEAVVGQNRDQCVAFMKGGDLGAWQSWHASMAPKLSKGECVQPLTYTVFDYLDIGKSWQRPIQVCKGDKVHIWATTKDRYRISDDGDWINVEGIPGTKPTESDWPCNIEGCQIGMLVGKFEPEEGATVIFPIGGDHVFVAPENGTVSYSINDNAWYDNKWFKSATIEDRTAVTIEPGN